ncbi:hypothetical protein [Sphingomonas sp. H160509]|uniref:hypothetical protein n=1 Tax=Sphingomonas sp. H160509 TaxID=2955313 RepID=UPI0031590DA1
MQRTGLHRVEPDLCVGPLAVADRREHGPVGLALARIELVGDLLDRRCADQLRRAEPRVASGLAGNGRRECWEGGGR